jgi:hypothetical protein
VRAAAQIQSAAAPPGRARHTHSAVRACDQARVVWRDRACAV